MSNILIVSNGHGEAAIAGYIAEAIRGRAPSTVIEHLPLVGRVAAGAWPRGVGPQADMPSGGLVSYAAARNVLRDVRAGLIGLTLRQFGYLRRQRARDAILAVGDVYCLWMCLRAARPTVFVATAKSEYVSGHSQPECAIARRAAHVFARDTATARALSWRGVKASWAGNVMMDGVAGGDPTALRVSATALGVGILPGSRADATRNAIDGARRLQKLAAARGPAQGLLSLTPAIREGQILGALRDQGYETVEDAQPSGVVAQMYNKGLRLTLRAVRGRFADLLAASDIVFGQAGTANEQAAGLGKPVFAASDPGVAVSRVGWYRQRQQRLLGDALLVLPDDDEAFVDGVLRVLADTPRLHVMMRTGTERMGPPGAASAIAGAVLALAKGPQ